jgi:O-antigen biosynthesis protein WbqV
MAGKVVLAGSARAICAALNTYEHASGAVVLGGGEVPLPVLARAQSWRELNLEQIDLKSIILAAPPANGVEARTIVEAAAKAGKTVSVLERGKVRRLRLDDLIGRPLSGVDDARIRAMIAGKRVLITGGGGSIGSELARRVLSYGPARLTIFDNSEFNLFRIGHELPQAVPVLADIRDQHAVRRWFGRERPEIVFHAAALKQVPIVEAFASEGVMTNIAGLRYVAEAAHGVGAELIFVSTDKAVDPSGIMGATKRLGELYCQALDRRGPHRAIPVRLGNVLGSTGSVVPTFEAQLAQGGPLTVTDPEVTRFFLTIPQAAESLLQAAAVGLENSTRGAAFVLDMGEALRIVDLAREMIRLEGRQPETDVPIVFTGLRPGEKLHELLVGIDEVRAPDPAPGVIAALSEQRGLAGLHEAMDRLFMLARDGAKDVIRQELFAALAPASVMKRDHALAG